MINSFFCLFVVLLRLAFFGCTTSTTTTRSSSSSSMGMHSFIPLGNLIVDVVIAHTPNVIYLFFRFWKNAIADRPRHRNHANRDHRIEKYDAGTMIILPHWPPNWRPWRRRANRAVRTNGGVARVPRCWPRPPVKHTCTVPFTIPPNENPKSCPGEGEPYRKRFGRINASETFTCHANFSPSFFLADSFLENDALRHVRERFFQGELPHPTAGTTKDPTKSKLAHRSLTLPDCLNRVDARLRRIVIKACTNSYAATTVIERFETFLVRAFTGQPCGWKEDDRGGVDESTTTATTVTTTTTILLEPPTITDRHDSDQKTIRFYFDNDPASSTAGFHRLLLVAVCQFHGLASVSKTIDIQIGQHSSARGLTVTGSLKNVETAQFRLVDAVAKKNAVAASGAPDAGNDMSRMVERVGEMALRV